MKTLDRNSQEFITDGKLLWKILLKIGLLSKEDYNTIQKWLDE